MSGIEQNRPDTPFPGVVGRTVEESSPAWPASRIADYETEPARMMAQR